MHPPHTHTQQKGRRKLRKTLTLKPNYKVDLSTEEEGQKTSSEGEHVHSDPSDKMPGSTHNDASDVEEKPRVCTKVKTKVIKTKGQLSVRHHRLHGKKIRQRKYKCKLCDNVSKQQKEHNKHMQTKHKDKKFQCFHCDREFTSDSAICTNMRGLTSICLMAVHTVLKGFSFLDKLKLI